MLPSSTLLNSHQLALQAALARPCYTVNFSWRKHKFAQQFLGLSAISAVRHLHMVPPGATALLWGMDCDKIAPNTGVSVLRLEDGFIRSVGLGADLVAPISWVADAQGMYFDATRPSSLEALLQTYSVDEATLLRAATLRERIVKNGITKYNYGQISWQRPAASRHVVLVPGQVESDASIRLGTQKVCTNLALLKAVRLQRPDSYIVYKPHPDVTAGLRGGAYGDAQTLTYCNEILVDTSVAQLLAQVDEVHVMTSLMGFEALMRGVTVCTYGAPFYAGWGLTQDVGSRDAVTVRRTRRRSLDELVAIALLVYPMYVSTRTHQPITAEDALDELQSQLQASPRFSLNHIFRRLLRPLLAMGARLRGGF